MIAARSIALVTLIAVTFAHAVTARDTMAMNAPPVLCLGKTSASIAVTPKTYAVFVASYNPTTHEARGGVAGSAFFISPTTAVTAFHVLQPKSFVKPEGFQQTQIWLVHEGEPAIELSASELETNAGHDTTVIHLAHAKTNRRFVLQTMEPSQQREAHFETDGFVASSTGPILALNNGGRLKITNTPHLERVHVEGHLLGRAEIDLTSQDVNLKHAPCLQLTYKPVMGISGAPVMSGGFVIAMNSFADPQARASTWAIELKSALHN